MGKHSISFFIYTTSGKSRDFFSVMRTLAQVISNLGWWLNRLCAKYPCHRHCYSSERCVLSHSPWPKLDFTLLALLTWFHAPFSQLLLSRLHHCKQERRNMLSDQNNWFYWFWHADYISDKICNIAWYSICSINHSLCNCPFCYFFLQKFKQMPGLQRIIKQGNQGRLGRFSDMSQK